MINDFITYTLYLCAVKNRVLLPLVVKPPPFNPPHSAVTKVRHVPTDTSFVVVRVDPDHVVTTQ